MTLRALLKTYPIEKKSPHYDFNHGYFKCIFNQAWWHVPVILALETVKQIDDKFAAKVGYITRTCHNQIVSLGFPGLHCPDTFVSLSTAINPQTS